MQSLWEPLREVTWSDDCVGGGAQNLVLPSGPGWQQVQFEGMEEVARVSVQVSPTQLPWRMGFGLECPASTRVPPSCSHRLACSFPHAPQLCPTPAAQEEPLRASSSALPVPITFVKPTK